MHIPIDWPILITAIFTGAATGYLGSLMITKKMSLVGDALGHLALPGIGLALVWGQNITWGALAFLFVGVILIWLLETRTHLSTETLVGVTFVLSLAVGFLITPEPELLEALIGDISRVRQFDAWVAGFLSVVILAVAYKIYSKLMLSFLSEDLASSVGVNVKKYNLFYLLIIAIAVALGIKVVGSLLVGAMLIVPAAAARNLSHNMSQYALGSAAIGVLSCILGVFISFFMKAGLLGYYVNLPVGPVIILASIFFFAISLCCKIE